ncbi:MAG: hypothetical protein ACEQSR_14775 [Candidatus Methylacidiphilales bacterium]
MTFISSKKFYGFILFLFFSININAQIFDGLRLGGGIGKSIYWGTQMDFVFSTNTYGKSELNNGYNFQIYKTINRTSEIGFRYLNTELWSFKSKNTLALNAHVDEFSIIYQYSLNNNIDLSSSPVTINLVAGLGLITFKSIFYSINSPNDFSAIYSSVGYGNEIGDASTKKEPNKVTAIEGIAGINLGVRLFPNLSLYLENSFTLSGSNKITGNLLTNSSIPANGYTYHALSLYLNFGNQKGKIRCPRF